MKNEDPTAPAEGGHQTGGDEIPATPEQSDAVLADIDALIAEIEEAPAGSDALDSRIHFRFRVAMERCPDVGALLFREGITWLTVKQALEAQIQPYTTSLDAALEGEEITFVVHAVRQGKWGAMQRTRHGEEVLVWAATEALARRLAAIKAWRAQFVRALAQMEKMAEPAEQDRAPPAAAAPVAAPAPDAAEDESAPARNPKPAETRHPAIAAQGKKDWEVLF